MDKHHNDKWTVEKTQQVNEQDFDPKYFFPYTKSVTKAIDFLNKGFPWKEDYAVVFSQNFQKYYLLRKGEKPEPYVVGKKLPRWAKPWRIDYVTTNVNFAKINHKYLLGVYNTRMDAINELNSGSNPWPYDYAVIYASDIGRYVLFCKRKKCEDRQPGGEHVVYNYDSKVYTTEPGND